MIHGVVNARHAVVRLRMRGPGGGSEVEADAVIDTGFSASLALPAATVAAVGLPRHAATRAMLADGSIRRLDVYAAEVHWDGRWRPVLASAMGGEVLVGMRLLTGHQIRIEVVPGGAVAVAPLP